MACCVTGPVLRVPRRGVGECRVLEDSIFEAASTVCTVSNMNQVPRYFPKYASAQIGEAAGTSISGSAAHAPDRCRAGGRIEESHGIVDHGTRKACCRADFIAYGIALASGVAVGPAR